MRALSDPGQSRARYGEDVRPLRTAAPLLSVSAGAPMDILVERASERSASALVRPRMCHGLGTGPSYGVAQGVRVVAPQVALQQLAARATLVRAVMLSTELCGSFSVYEPLACVRELLQELVDAGRLPVMSRWSPVLSADGRLTSLWSRPPLVSPACLLDEAGRSKAPRGRARLAEATRLTVAGAASPLEARAGILLGFPQSRGGEGYAGLSHNVRVDLSEGARRLARRGHLVCDLYWATGEGGRALDLECQSSLIHGAGGVALSDADRAAALELEGVDVVFATHGQVSDPGRFGLLSRLVADKLGLSYHVKSPAQREREALLRSEVFEAWEGLPLV